MVDAAPTLGALGATVSFTASAPTAEAGRASASNAAAKSFMSGPDSRVAFVEPISFARGVPAPECLALEELADSARAAIERDGATALNYGPAGGYAPLREWIADRHRVEPERVVLTNGSLQGFRILAELLSPTGTVIVEAAPALGAFGTTVSFTASAPTAEAGRASASNAAARSFMSGPDSRVALCGADLVCPRRPGA